MNAYLRMTKPTIVMLIVVTAMPALLMASAGAVDVIVWTVALIGTVLSAASASVFNHVFDAQLDQQMTRTRNRPLARGQVTKRQAIIFASLLAIGALAILAWGTTLTATGIAFGGIVFYALVYTLILKRHTPQNIVIGGAAGAVGPLIGWAAVTGELSWVAWLLSLIIFLWTPPHFWALAIYYRHDYQRAQIPMYPAVYGVKRTKRAIICYVVTLLPVWVTLYLVSSCSLVFLLISLTLTGYFLRRAWLFNTDTGDSMALFRFSCLYILLLFAGLAVDQVVVLLL